MFSLFRSQLKEDPATAVPQRSCLIVGLGNPGAEYRANRHNIGFMAVDLFAKTHAISVNRAKSHAVIGEGRVAGISVILAKPQTYMNNSGFAVGQLLRFYKIPLTNLLVIYDELDIPFGALRLREKGSAGGHNGMRSIIQHIGSDFPRLRLGIGRPTGQMPASAFVLQNFAPIELPTIQILLQEAVAAVETFVQQGIQQTMNQHNRKTTSEP